MSIVIWNVRSLGNPRALDKLQILIRDTSPDLVFVMDTRLCSEVAGVEKRRIGFDNGFNV